MKDLWQNKTLLIFHYIVSLGMSLLVGVPFFKTLIKASKNTVSLNPLIQDFDFMLFSDAINAFSESLKPYILVFFAMLALFIFISTFLSGGTVDAIANKRFKFQRFLIHCWRYWGKTIAISLLNLFLLFIILILTGALIYVFDEAYPTPDFRENVLIRLPALIFFLLGLAIIFMLWDYARTALYKNRDIGIFENYFSAIKQVFLNKYPAKMFLWIVVLVILSTSLYLFLDNIIGMTSTFTIIIMIAFQQVFVFLRIFIRLLHLQMAYNFKK